MLSSDSDAFHCLPQNTQLMSGTVRRLVIFSCLLNNIYKSIFVMDFGFNCTHIVLVVMCGNVVTFRQLINCFMKSFPQHAPARIGEWLKTAKSSNIMECSLCLGKPFCLWNELLLQIKLFREIIHFSPFFIRNKTKRNLSMSLSM